MKVPEKPPQKLIGVCHCVLNPCSKVLFQDEKAFYSERALINEALKLIVEQEIGILQLPCPEFTMYGPLRWGHVKSQFDNVFFRAHCCSILQPAVDQLCEYAAHPDLYLLIGIAGIDGSPSCGVKQTCSGDWCGELFQRNDSMRGISTASMVEGRGVFIEELAQMLTSKGLELPVFPVHETWKYL